ncbi:MAG: DUF998 domain-containing protein [Promethearchaeota archaeon]
MVVALGSVSAVFVIVVMARSKCSSPVAWKGVGGLSQDARKLSAAIAGVIAPFLYLILVFGLGFLEPGYNQMTDMMSILGGVEGLRGWLFNLGVIIIGLLVAIFGLGLHPFLNDGDGSKVGPSMLVLGGIGLIGGGIFHCDQDCTNFLTRNPTGIMHMISSALAGMLIAMSLFVLYFRIRRDPVWERLGGFTLLMALLGNGAGITLWITFATTRLSAIEGLIQRVGIIAPLLWIAIVSLQMLSIVRNQ